MLATSGWDYAPGDCDPPAIGHPEAQEPGKDHCRLRGHRKPGNSGMADAREGTSFTPQAAKRFWIRGRLVKGLDRHGTTEALIPAFVDHTIPPAPIFRQIW